MFNVPGIQCSRSILHILLVVLKDGKDTYKTFNVANSNLRTITWIISSRLQIHGIDHKPTNATEAVSGLAEPNLPPDLTVDLIEPGECKLSEHRSSS